MTDFLSSLNRDQRAAATATEGYVRVIAGAGTQSDTRIKSGGDDRESASLTSSLDGYVLTIPLRE